MDEWQFSFEDQGITWYVRRDEEGHWGRFDAPDETWTRWRTVSRYDLQRWGLIDRHGDEIPREVSEAARTLRMARQQPKPAKPPISSLFDP